VTPAGAPFRASGSAPVPWSQGSRELAAGETYWLATAGPAGVPHVRPVLAVWLDDVLYFASGASTRKARNLVRDPRCALAVSTPLLDLVLEGHAALERDPAVLRRVAGAYAAKYGWHVTVRDGAFHGAEGAPTAGPPPYDVYAVRPQVVYGHTADGTLTSTRWTF
jgi:hypothetical protein